MAGANHKARARAGDGQAGLPATSQRPGDSPRLRYFTRDEIVRFTNAAQGMFRDLVRAGLYTGCRYGELGRLRAGDFNRDSGTIFIGKSKSGKARHVILAAEGQKFFSTLAAGKPSDALLLTRG